MPLLEIKNLSVEFPSQNGMVRAVDGVNITLEKGEVLGIVGEAHAHDPAKEIKRARSKIRNSRGDLKQSGKSLF